jgi:RNA polymerase sigma-70 factor, ECF subfamily
VPVPHDDFAEFYQASYVRVVGLVAAVVGDRQQAEDIAQEAFAQALTRWPRVARYDLPEAWVRRVALRLTVDANRRMRRARHLSALLAAGQHGRGQPRDPVAATALSLALRRLPLPQRQVLVLYYMAAVAAAGDDHTFALAGPEAGSVVFYELGLGPGGKPQYARELFTFPASAVPAFAVSPDASMLAYTTGRGLETVSLATGTGRAWTVSGGLAYSLSWAGDRTLAFEWAPRSLTGASLPPGAGVRLLDVVAPGPLLQASRLIIGYCASGQVCAAGPLITPDGSRVLATRVVLGTGITTNVEEYSARTGQALAAVTPAVGSPNGDVTCQALWTDPSGEQVVAFCGRGERDDGGHVSPVSLQLPAGILNARGQDFAW